MSNRKRTGAARRWVIKIGSALITNDGRGLAREAIGGWVAQMAALRERGTEIVLVSSGAVAEGMRRLGWASRPKAVHELQAAAAVGQMGLVQVWESRFKEHGLHTAQVLLTHDDVARRDRYLNARSALRTLLGLGVVPVVNENDTVATDEIRLGDNDTLGAMVANLVEAQLLVILTDQGGLYEADPRTHPGVPLVREGRAGDPALLAMAGGSGSLGRGGMQTKLRAATLAAHSGTATIIAPGRRDGVLLDIGAGEEVGTLLLPSQAAVGARKQWLAGQLRSKGRLHLDEGAARVLRESGRSLLAVGVREVEGRFGRGELVSCIGPDGREVARGLVNYGSDEARRIAGKPSSQIEELLGYVYEPEVIHRDNLVVTD
ncbi:MAG: glutamate 5-kinase [Gammaproteobacteria bacterium]|nr:glutamate 5-kinase [Gammaproteobacteria bacterium]